MILEIRNLDLFQSPNNVSSKRKEQVLDETRTTRPRTGNTAENRGVGRNAEQARPTAPNNSTDESRGVERDHQATPRHHSRQHRRTKIGASMQRCNRCGKMHRQQHQRKHRGSKLTNPSHRRANSATETWRCRTTTYTSPTS